jgi:hypothetical protein
MNTASPADEGQFVPGVLTSFTPNILGSLSGATQSTLLAGGSTYLALAPKLTTLTMYAADLDTLPEKVRDAAEGVISAGWTGAAMLAVGGIAWAWKRFSKNLEA